MRLVNTLHANRMPDARPSSSACEEPPWRTPVACGEHPGEVGLEVDRLGGGALHGLLDAAHHALDGAQQAGLDAGRLEHLAHEEGGGGLPLVPVIRRP